VLEKGSLLERMTWIARLYDLDGDGYIARDDLEDIIFSVFDLLGKAKETDTVLRCAVREKVDKILEEIAGVDEGERISLERFSEYCLSKYSEEFKC